MVTLGYEAWGEYGIPGRRFFVKGVDKRTHHVHTFQTGSFDIARHLYFRDYLITHPDDATAYADLKIKLAKKFSGNRKAYVENKQEHVKKLEEYVPGKGNLETMYMERYPRDIRWTGRLQKLLGDNFYVIEEGLNGRTTNIDSPIPPDRNGKTYLASCLYTHSPLDLVVLMLGGNDLKNIFHRTAEDIANGLADLIQLIQSTKYGSGMQSSPEILLIGYPQLSHDDGGRYFGDKDFYINGVARSKQFDFYFSLVAKKYQCHYFNMAPHIHMSDIDGIHLDEKAHEIFANLILIEVK